MTVKRARFHCGAVWLSFVFDFKQLLKYSGQEFLVRHARRKYFLYSLACLCTVLMVFFHKLVFYVSLLLRGQLLISASQRGPPVSSGPPNANCRCALVFGTVSPAGCAEGHQHTCSRPSRAPSRRADPFQGLAPSALLRLPAGN